MKTLKALFLAAALALTLTAPAVVVQAAQPAALEWAQYGEVYQGPKTLTVELVATKTGDQALVRLSGINHEWNNKVFLADIRKVYAPYRLEYQVKLGGETHTLMWTESEGRPGSAVFLKPNQGNPLANKNDAIPVSFDKTAALNLQPATLATAWGKQAK